MLISFDWLKQYLPDLDNFTPQSIAEQLSSKLAEVEQIISVRDKLKDIVVGEILEVDKHPTKDKLHICKVTTGKNEYSIVCGAPNVKVGMRVAVCLIGGSVYDITDNMKQRSTVITQKEVAGVVSEGMLCSAKELDLYDSHEGIIELDPSLELNTELVTLLSDIVFEIENKSLSHRPDCFSHKGIAREIAAFLNIKFVETVTEIPIIPTSDLSFNIDIKTEFCGRLSAISLKDLTIKDSPLWMICRLTAIGIRPINNVVDITNYVMHDIGQPLHAYDYDKLSEKKLIARMAKASEEFTALDGKTYKLNENTITITDGSETLGIAGIIGGQSSEISQTTKNIIIESANFNMYSIRKASMQIGVRTDASTRFEKGQDPNNTIIGLTQAVELMSDLAHPEIASEIKDNYPTKLEPKEINFDLSLVSRSLGVDLDKETILGILSRLNLISINDEQSATISNNSLNNETILLTIPSYRPDLKLPVDILEEIARIYGYEKIVPSLPTKSIDGKTINRVTSLIREIKTIISSQGIDEVATYSFIGDDFLAKLGLDNKLNVKITNSISPELNNLRNNILPSLIEKISLNAAQFDKFGLFELGRVVLKEESKENGLYKQPYHLAFVLYEANAKNLYARAKGILEFLSNKLHIQLTFQEISKQMPLSNILHEYRRANITFNNEAIGVVAEMNPYLYEKLQIKGRVGLLEINIDPLFDEYSLQGRYKQLSLFPEVKRDISFWVKTDINYQLVANTLNEFNKANDLVKNFKLIDTYMDEKNSSKISYTFSITLQGNDKTLSEKEINPVMADLTAYVTKELKAEVRE